MSGYINKIMVDSRFKTSTSASNPDFTIELNENIMLPDRTGCVVTDIVIPRTWYGVNTSNNKLYFRIVTQIGYQDFIITLPPQNYTLFILASSIATLMNQAVDNQFFSAVPNSSTGTLQITLTQSGATNLEGFYIFTDQDLRTRVNNTWTGHYYNFTNLFSINQVLRNDENNFTQYNNNNPFNSGVVDLIAIHTLYITSSTLSTYNNIGPRGERNILKKIVSSSQFGDLIIQDTWLDSDFTDVSNRPLKIIDFKLVDVYGNVIDLNGGSISFSLLFINI